MPSIASRWSRIWLGRVPRFSNEPTTALDVTIQAPILRLLADIQKKSGVSLILITHDIGVVASIADTIAVMYRGGWLASRDAARRRWLA